MEEHLCCILHDLRASCFGLSVQLSSTLSSVERSWIAAFSSTHTSVSKCNELFLATDQSNNVQSQDVLFVHKSIPDKLLTLIITVTVLSQCIRTPQRTSHGKTSVSIYERAH